MHSQPNAGNKTCLSRIAGGFRCSSERRTLTAAIRFFSTSSPSLTSWNMATTASAKDPGSRGTAIFRLRVLICAPLQSKSSWSGQSLAGGAPGVSLATTYANEGFSSFWLQHSNASPSQCRRVKRVNTVSEINPPHAKLRLPMRRQLATASASVAAASSSRLFVTI